MAFHKLLNAIYDLNNYLVCKMLEGTLEIQVKVKTTWGKFTIVQNTHTRTEKYHTWEKPQQCHIKSRKGRIPHKAASVHTEENCSEIDICTDLVFENAPQNFTCPTYTAAVTHTDSEEEVTHKTNFLGKYCEYCDRCGETHCWCFTSNWEEGNDANNTNSSMEILTSPTARQPPAGWSKNRCRGIKETGTTGTPPPREEISTDSGTSMH